MRPALGIVFCLALVNALRRSLFNLADEPHAGIRPFAESLLLGLLVGCIMVVAAAAVLKRYPAAGGRQVAAMAGSIAVSSAFGVLVKDLYEWEVAAGSGALQGEFQLPAYFLMDWVRYLVPGALLAGACLHFRSQALNAALLHRYAVESADMERRAAEARLRLLEAQVEPHFLFNTLASVKRLFRTDAAAAERMLDDLVRYLSVALPRVRQARSSVAAEAALAGSFLEIHRVRMGRRMQYNVSFAPALGDAIVPPFMLLTLVENAVKHAIAPLPEGGRIDVIVQEAGAELIVQVRDNGRGLAGTSGSGTGLANLRARLQLLYGSAASLRLSRNEPSGVVATVVLPLEQPSRAGAP